ncbi:unnamed protein product [Rotaria sp. Silwood1]|nr:unnamed protein product [Rotaria sp. Silwood1]
MKKVMSNLLHLSISDKTSKKVRIVRKRAQIQTNKLQCQRLSLRIDQLIDPLERLEHASLIFYEEIHEHENDYEKFEKLNKRLSQLGQDLCLELNIQELFDQKQNREDQQQDLHELNKILSQMSQQHQEQYKQIDKIIHHLESFHFDLEQKFLNQSDSNQEKTRV